MRLPSHSAEQIAWILGWGFPGMTVRMGAMLAGNRRLVEIRVLQRAHVDAGIVGSEGLRSRITIHIAELKLEGAR